ncbi:MAG: hypothetical protein JST23_03660 [Bacteroidetes bacterium]|nr:hypothetical protein [Bacteroidota bacterium]
MRKLLSDRNLIVLLFVITLVAFSLAQEDTRKMEGGISNAQSITPIYQSNQNKKLATSTFQTVEQKKMIFIK